MLELFSDAVMGGLDKFRSKAEEEDAKARQNQPPVTDKPKEEDNGFDVAGFILGRR